VSEKHVSSGCQKTKGNSNKDDSMDYNIHSAKRDAPNFRATSTSPSRCTHGSSDTAALLRHSQSGGLRVRSYQTPFSGTRRAQDPSQPIGVFQADLNHDVANLAVHRNIIAAGSQDFLSLFLVMIREMEAMIGWMSTDPQLGPHLIL
jgi:hypothetical protein